MFKAQEEVFKRKLADMVDEKYAKLHWKYQELLKDHLDDPLPQVLRTGQLEKERPDD